MLNKIKQTLIHFIDSLYFCLSSTMQKTQLHSILGLIVLGTVSRLLPHPPNFTAMNAIALFSVCSFGNLGLSLFAVLTTMLFSDFIFGLHSSIAFVYLSFGLMILMGNSLKSKRSILKTTVLLVLSSLLFFIITNFGVWLMDAIYPKTLTGLGLCYLAGIPFLVNNLMGTLVYGGILFGWFAVAERKETLLETAKPSSV